MFYSSNGEIIKNDEKEGFINIPFFQFVSAKNAGVKSSKNIEADEDILAQGNIQSTSNIESNKDIVAQGKVKSYLLESNKINTEDAVFDELDVNKNINVSGMLTTDFLDSAKINVNNIDVDGNFKLNNGILSVNGNVDVLKDINTNHFNVKGDIMTNGGNNWIYHTPDDKRHILYIAPSKTYGFNDWNWNRCLSIDNNGKLVVRGDVHSESMHIKKTCSVKQDIVTNRDLITSGGNNWIFHTPNDRRHTLYISPSKTKGKHDWNWSKCMSIDQTGSTQIRGSLVVHKNVHIKGWNVIESNFHTKGYITVNKNAHMKRDAFVDRNFFVKDNLVFHGGNNWILHTPNDGRHILYIAPSGTYNKHNWNWGAQVRIEPNGKALATGGFHSTSDSRVKSDIKKLNNSLEKINKISGYSFIRKDFEVEKQQIGLIAQDVEKEFPEVVDTDEKDGMKSISYDNLVAPLVESIKDLTKLNSNLTKRIEELEKIISNQ